MADFVKDQMNQSQTATEKQNVNDQVAINKETLDALSNILQDILNQLKNDARQDKKDEQTKKSILDFLKSKLAATPEKLAEKLNLQNSLGKKSSFMGVVDSASNGIKKFANELKGLGGNFARFGSMLNIAIITLQSIISNMILLDNNQTKTNDFYLQTHGLSALNNDKFYSYSRNKFRKDVLKLANRYYDEEAVQNAMLNLKKYYNLNNLSDEDVLERTRKTLSYNRLSPQLQDVYNTMLGQSGGNQRFIESSLGLMTQKFDKSDLGMDRSLQQTKALYESNRRLGMSMNEAAGYVLKFNKQLQDGVLTLQDLTMMKNAVQNKSLGEDAGLAQMLLNSGLGTKKLISAAGNPFKMASIIRQGGKDELDAIQKMFWDLSENYNFGNDREARGEYLRDLYSKFGFNLSKEQVRLVSRGRNSSLQAGSVAPKKGTPSMSADMKLNTQAGLNEELTTSLEDKLTNDINNGKKILLTTINDFQSSIGNLLQNTDSLGKALDPCVKLFNKIAKVGNKTANYIDNMNAKASGEQVQ